MSTVPSTETLPTGWKVSSLGDVAKWGSGGTPKSGTAAFYGGPIKWAVIGDLTESWVSETAQSITKLGLEKSSAKVIVPGTVLLAMYGASIGRTGIAAVEMATNQAIAFAVPQDGILDAQYLLKYLQSQKESFVRAGQGGAQPNISQTVIKPWPMPLPPLDEQVKIVEILEEQLSRLDAALAAVHAVRDKSARFRRSLLHAAFTGVLTAIDAENSNTDVRVSVFEDLFDLVSNERRQVKQRDYKSSGRFPVVDQGEEIVGGFIDDGDLLFDGALPVIVFGDHTRRLKFIDFPFVVGADGTKLIQCKEAVLPRYGFYHLEAAEFRNRGYARHFAELKKVMFWLPSIRHQEKIIEMLEEQFSCLEASLAVADAIEKKALALRRSLLHAAFTGNLTKEWRESAHV